MSNTQPLTITNPTTGATFTTGKRGRIAGWVLDMIDSGAIADFRTVKENKPAVKGPVTPITDAVVKTDSDGKVTITNPTTGETWTSGKRGRKPSWVMALESAGTAIPKRSTYVPATKRQEISADLPPIVPGSLRAWRYVGQTDNEGDEIASPNVARCIIVASDEITAIRVANKTLTTPLTSHEINIMWRPVDRELIPELAGKGIDIMSPGVWESKNGTWAARKPKT